MRLSTFVDLLDAFVSQRYKKPSYPDTVFSFEGPNIETDTVQYLLCGHRFKSKSDNTLIGKCGAVISFFPEKKEEVSKKLDALNEFVLRELNANKYIPEGSEYPTL